MLTWLVNYAAQFLKLYKVLPNGRKGYDITTGHRLNTLAVPFCEKVHFRVAPDKGDQLLTTRSEGIFLGNHPGPPRLLSARVRTSTMCVPSDAIASG